MSVNQTWKSKTAVVMVLAIIAVLAGSLLPAQTVHATPGSGVTAETIVTGALTNPIASKFKPPSGNVQADVTRTTIVKYTIIPGGVFGWHMHGGPLWVTVASGTLSFYEASDPTCTPTVYQAGTTFMDPGNHPHNARNEGSTDLVIYAVFMLPPGGAPRVDIPNPGNCAW